MDRPTIARAAMIVTIALFALTPLLANGGAPVGVVSALSTLGVITLAVAVVAVIAVASRQTNWALYLGVIAAVTQTGAALLLLVHEPQPAFEHPEWAWYWPVVNTLYVGGVIVAIVVLISAVIALVRGQTLTALAALALGVLAFALNRVAPYR